MRRSITRFGRAASRAAHLCVGLAAAGLILFGAGFDAAANPAKQLFGKLRTPSAQGAEVIGGYARGCLAGAVQLAADGPGWQAMRLSRNRRWGHPDLIAFIERLAEGARGAGWPGVLVGDLAQPRGGPMLTGHRSHQTGIDGDIWLKPAPDRTLSSKERERLSAVNYVARDRRNVVAAFSAAHHRVLRAAAEDPALARIFVNAAIKKALCERAAARGEPTAWLRKIRPWYGHDHHFHVRLNCPATSRECQPQDPPPPGDGCGADLAWWFSDDVLNPKPDPNAPPPKKRRALRLADLPANCATVLRADAK